MENQVCFNLGDGRYVPPVKSSIQSDNQNN